MTNGKYKTTMDAHKDTKRKQTPAPILRMSPPFLDEKYKGATRPKNQTKKQIEKGSKSKGTRQEGIFVNHS
jgi:hypothetical protein